MRPIDIKMSRKQTLKNKAVLVTGSTGFLGGWLAKRLAETEGAQVRALARRPQRAEFLRGLPNIEIIEGDVTDFARMEEVVAGCDFVFHTAINYQDMQSQYRVNVIGTQNVIQAAANAQVRRFIHVSSIAAYGYNRAGDIYEDDMLYRMDGEPYNLTKIAAEEVVRATAAATGLPYSIIRPGMIYGTGSGMWTRTIFKLSQRKPILFLGDGGGHAQPIYVDDVLDQLVLLATHPAAENETFNCTPDPAPTWRDFIMAYANLTQNTSWFGLPPTPIKWAARMIAAAAPRDSIVQAAPDVIANSLLGAMTFKTDKARDLLGWQPKVSLPEGVVRCEAYLREVGLLK